MFSATIKNVETESNNSFKSIECFNFQTNTLQEDIKVPELLTPNGDGKNDVWEIKGIENYEKNKVTVFNRWGNKVFEMEQYDNSWDGESNADLAIGDSKLPAGTYFYILELDNIPIKGFLYISR